jgi:hypothetical protein
MTFDFISFFFTSIKNTHQPSRGKLSVFPGWFGTTDTRCSLFCRLHLTSLTLHFFGYSDFTLNYRRSWVNFYGFVKQYVPIDASCYKNKVYTGVGPALFKGIHLNTHYFRLKILYILFLMYKKKKWKINTTTAA